MGLLKVGKPLTWQETIPHSRYIREHGVKQFLSTYKRVKDIENDHLFYGDEIEFSLAKIDPEKREVKLSLRGTQLLQCLNEREKHGDARGHCGGCTWHQEYGSWMVEGTPDKPYSGYTTSLLQVEQNMRLRRARLLVSLEPNEIAPTVVTFPLMGVGDFVTPSAPPGGPASLSSTVPDSCINPHPRFGTLTANIRERRGSKVDIRLPIFKDVKTTEKEVHMDCMAYGMGCCCLQVTFQACDVDEARYLYDQLATLAPIMLALTAAAPIFQGRLVDTDVRWKVISQSVDDRTPAERGEDSAAKPDERLVGGGVTRLSKSRYDSISTYISDSAHETPEVAAFYNDVPCEVDSKIEEELIKEGLGAALAKHVAHLFVRDPLVAFEGAIEEQDDETSVEHFESINSTNWQTMRWKPPPPRKQCGPHIGWRTEFRSMEVQLTDFENAAFTAFVVLVTRVLLVFDLECLMPLSKVDENMKRAHKVNSVLKEKFWFRRHVIPADSEEASVPRVAKTESDACEEMTLAEIMNGTKTFVGLIPMIYAYLDHIDCDVQSMNRISQYLTFIQKRTTGELLTPATWMRQFVMQHPDYKQDSVVSQSIAYDLMRACSDIGLGRRSEPLLHGDVVIEPLDTAHAYATQLRSAASDAARTKLLEQIRKRALTEDGPGSAPSAPLRKRARSRDRDGRGPH